LKTGIKQGIAFGAVLFSFFVREKTSLAVKLKYNENKLKRQLKAVDIV